ncbi:Protocadherin Fat 1 [Trichinella papuae]|uniref:Protocadherin Fat 1 n=1 Tax=Trichinella papuae TaxID=268474 RepID=A0A0V1MC68_9BILA|nr:Protocadherin Fat 1 [Trichinella papuae]
MKMSRNKVLLFVSMIWLLISGTADGSCPVSSTAKNFGGKLLEEGGCLTVVDISEPQKLYGQITVDHLHRFCMESFKGGRLLSFTDSQKLQILAGVNFKKDPTSTILLHPGVRVFKTNITTKQDVFVEKCMQMETLDCMGYPYEYISTRNEKTAGMLYQCAEKKCCSNSDCDDTDSLLTFESELLENVSDSSADAFCRCIEFNPTYLKWNLPAEHTYHCDHMKCAVFVCENDEYTDCKETRVKNCSYSLEAQSCKEFTYQVISEKELPYGNDCENRNYGESCVCPCGGTWTQWSIVSGTCGKVVSIRYRPRLDMVATNKSCDDAKASCCTETKDHFVVCDHYTYSKAEYEKFKAECEQHNGVVNASDAELVCVCFDDRQFGTFCENTFDACSEQKWCQNGGSCRNYKGSYRCDCMDNYSGENCTDIIKTCLSNAECMNGGICALLHSGKACKCTEGFAGANCELKIGKCKAHVCMNGASCLQVNNNTYKCDCSYNYEGTFCEEELSITEILIRLVKGNLTLHLVVIIIMLILLVICCISSFQVVFLFYLFYFQSCIYLKLYMFIKIKIIYDFWELQIISAHRTLQKLMYDKLFGRAKRLRQKALDEHAAKQKSQQEELNSQSLSSSSVG